MPYGSRCQRGRNDRRCVAMTWGVRLAIAMRAARARSPTAARGQVGGGARRATPGSYGDGEAGFATATTTESGRRTSPASVQRVERPAEGKQTARLAWGARPGGGALFSQSPWLRSPGYTDDSGATSGAWRSSLR